jgi:hypothetical protein
MGRKRILKDGKKVRKSQTPKKKKKKKREEKKKISLKANKTGTQPGKKQNKKKKKKKKTSYTDWITWNRSLTTASLEDIKREDVTTKIMGNVILKEIMLEI